MNNVTIQNPSAWNSLRVASQNRLRNTFEKAPAALPPAPTRHTRAELEKMGREVTMTQTRVSTKHGSEMRETPVAFYEAAGYASLAEFCTESEERQVRESQKAIAPAPKVQHVVDDWSSPTPYATIMPHGTLHLPLDEGKRFLIESDDEVALQVSNVSQVRTLRLRNRNSKTGETSHVAFIAPARDYAQAALVISNGKSAACIELMPS